MQAFFMSDKACKALEMCYYITTASIGLTTLFVRSSSSAAVCLLYDV